MEGGWELHGEKLQWKTSQEKPNSFVGRAGSGTTIAKHWRQGWRGWLQRRVEALKLAMQVWGHAELGTAIKMRRVKETVVRTE